MPDLRVAVKNGTDELVPLKIKITLAGFVLVDTEVELEAFSWTEATVPMEADHET